MPYIKFTSVAIMLSLALFVLPERVIHGQAEGSNPWMSVQLKTIEGRNTAGM